MVAFVNHLSMCKQICICKLIRWPAYYAVSNDMRSECTNAIAQQLLFSCNTVISSLIYFYWEVNHKNNNEIPRAALIDQTSYFIFNK